jgi:hypothetical protein
LGHAYLRAQIAKLGRDVAKLQAAVEARVRDEKARDDAHRRDRDAVSRRGQASPAAVALGAGVSAPSSENGLPPRPPGRGKGRR